MGTGDTWSPRPATRFVRRCSSAQRRATGTLSGSNGSSSRAIVATARDKVSCRDKIGRRRTLLAEATEGLGSGGIVRHLNDERPARANGRLDDVELEAEQSLDECRLAVALHAHHDELRHLEADGWEATFVCETVPVQRGCVRVRNALQIVEKRPEFAVHLRGLTLLILDTLRFLIADVVDC